MKKNIMYKKIVLFSFLSLSPLTIAATTISCGSSDNNQEPGDNNQKPIVTNELQKLLEEDKIKISPNSLGIPKTYFNDCLNNDLERQKFFYIQKNDLNLNLKLEVLSQGFLIEDSDITARLKLTNLDNSEVYE